MLLRTCALVIAAGVALFSVLASVSRSYVIGGDSRIVRADARFNQLISPLAKLEKLADGFGLAEGPVWSKSGGYLLFSDLAANAVYKWTAYTGVEVFLQPSGYSGTEPFRGPYPGSNGLAFDSAGRLVLCEHGDRRITRIEPDGSKTILADRFRGKRLNSPNDLTFDSKGNLYFTDPPFGLPHTFDDPGQELGFSGVYRLSPTGQLTLLTDKLRGPNGIAFAPSERTLYVSDTLAAEPGWMAYDVNEDAILSEPAAFLTTPAWAQTQRGARDGLKTDQFGNIFAAGAGGIHVFAPDGSHLGSIKIQAASNVAWGDDGSVLYVTGSKTIYRSQTLTAGHGF